MKDSPRGPLQRIVIWLLGEAAIGRLQALAELKQRAEMAEFMASLCGLASLHGEPPLGRTAAQARLEVHDRHAAEFNRLRFWWMPRMKLKLPDNTLNHALDGRADSLMVTSVKELP